MSNKVEEKYIACMVLHALGDTVGYKNSEWEFMKGSYENINKLYEFIDLGGVNHISLKDWLVSDDTIMHMQTADALLQNLDTINKFGTNLKNNFLQALKQFDKEGVTVRQPGITTMKSLNLLKKGATWEKGIPYNLYAGGSGASMRSLCIGLAFHGEKNRDKLMQFSIESGRMTNNSAVGYLGGLASALFTALAIEKKPINEWPYILLDLFKSGRVHKYIKTVGRDVEEFEKDHHVFVSKWHRYIEDKFDDNKKPIFRKINKNLVYRNKYYMDTFGFKETKREGSKTIEETSGFIGAGGDDSVIIAYDALIDSGQNWEKLIVYSMLHNGDTDTTGCIAAGLYGAIYGFGGVPNNFLEHLEYKKEITGLGKKLFKKFH